MSKVDAHWELIPQIVALRDQLAPQTLLTINGDIPDRQTGLELVEKYGVDGIMIGRGIFKNYVKGFPGESDLRVQLMNTKSTDEVRALLNAFSNQE